MQETLSPESCPDVSKTHEVCDCLPGNPPAVLTCFAGDAMRDWNLPWQFLFNYIMYLYLQKMT